jgi:protein involved in polysaccharide export with SLBB domain
MQQIQIERIVRNERQIVVDVDDRHLDKAKGVNLQDADLVKVFSIVDMNLNAVYLNGNVKRPGKYEYKPGMKMKDLVKDPQDLLPETFFDYALIKRLNPPGFETVLIPFHLGNLLFHSDSADNLEIRPQDNVFIFSKWFFKDKPYITVEGEVRKAGRFDLADNFRVKDAIMAAEDLTREASPGKAEIIRVNKKKEFETIYFDVSKAVQGDPRDNILLQDQDRIVIHSVWEREYKKSVYIDGEILKPGTYQFTDNMTVKDLIFKAGNILESAYLNDAEIVSMVVESGKISKYEIRNIFLKKALEGDSSQNMYLKPYDRLLVKKIPEWRDAVFASVSGQIRFPGKYPLRRGEKLSSLIDRAGGYTDHAYLRGAYFTRERVKELQQKSIMEMAMRMERELLVEGAVQVSTSMSAEEVQARRVELEQKKKLVESMKTLQATGRLTINLEILRILRGNEYDIALEDGDSLTIPEKNSVVNVVGAVMSNGSYVYSDKLDYEDYINQTGGYARYADKKNVFVLKVDGSARKLENGFMGWNSSRSRWERADFKENKRIEPGDVIVVPENVERIAWLREIKDITQILMQMAVTAGVTIKLF